MPPETNVKKNAQGLSVIYRVIPIDDGRLERLYAWIDDIPLSRPKKNIARDFADGVLLAEILKYFLPKLVELHNYGSSVGTRNNEANLYLLNRKVLPKLQVELSAEVIRAVAKGQALAIENVLLVLRDRIDIHLAKQRQRQHRPSWMNLSRDAELIEDVYDSNPNTARSGVMAMDSSRQSKILPWLPAAMNTPRTQESLPRELLEDKQREVDVKQDTIAMLQQKIERMEHLCYLKDIRIDDLNRQLEAVSEEVSSLPSPPVKPKPLKRATHGHIQPGNRQVQHHGNRPLQHRGSLIQQTHS